MCTTSEYQYIKEGGFGRLVEALNEIGVGLNWLAMSIGGGLL